MAGDDLVSGGDPSSSSWNAAMSGHRVIDRNACSRVIRSSGRQSPTRFRAHGMPLVW